MCLQTTTTTRTVTNWPTGLNKPYFGFKRSWNVSIRFIKVRVKFYTNMSKILKCDEDLKKKYLKKKFYEINSLNHLSYSHSEIFISWLKVCEWFRSDRLSELILHAYIFPVCRDITRFHIFYKANTREEKSIAVSRKTSSFKPGDKVGTSIIIVITLINLFIAFLYIVLCTVKQHLVSNIYCYWFFYILQGIRYRSIVINTLWS